MKKRETTVFIVLIISCLLIIFCYFTFIKKKEDQSRERFYMVIDNVANLMYVNNSWSYTNSSLIEKYGNYETYSYNNYLGKNSLEYVNTWNLFDKDKNFVNYKESLFAYSDNFNIKKINTSIRNITDVEKQEIISNFHYDDFNYLLSNEVLDIDLNNDGIMDKIVCVSNVNENKNLSDKYYNLIYIKLNDKIIEVVNQNSKNYNILRTDIYDLSYFFSYQKEKYFIIKKTNLAISDSASEEIIMYNYTNINKIFKVKVN